MLPQTPGDVPLWMPQPLQVPSTSCTAPRPCGHHQSGFFQPSAPPACQPSAKAGPGTSSTPAHFGENPTVLGLSWASIFPAALKHQNLGISPLSPGVRMSSPRTPRPCQPQGCSPAFSRALPPLKPTPGGESSEHPPGARAPRRAGASPVNARPTPAALGGTGSPSRPRARHVPPRRVTSG